VYCSWGKVGGKLGEKMKFKGKKNVNTHKGMITNGKKI
jgi:hypothetical protein